MARRSRRWTCGGSVQTGIYRVREHPSGAHLRLLPTVPGSIPQLGIPLIPVLSIRSTTCQLGASPPYIGSAADPKTWHLPYLHADGTPDLARLPKAIQAILSNYRGAHSALSPRPRFPRSWSPWPEPRTS